MKKLWNKFEERTYPIQVTKPQKTVEMLEGWDRFLRSKGFRTCVVTEIGTQRGGGDTLFTLHRSLTNEEIDGVKDKTYCIREYSLVYEKYFVIKSRNKRTKIVFSNKWGLK